MNWLQSWKHWPVISRLQPKYRDHALSGNFRGYRDLHVRPDLVLIYAKPDAGALQLVRLGSHSELFD